MAEEKLPFRADENALIKFEDAGSAAILRYNVPQPAEFNGRNYTELEVDSDIWTEKALQRPAAQTGGDEGDTGSSTGTNLNELNLSLVALFGHISFDDLPDWARPGVGPDPVPPFEELREYVRTNSKNHDPEGKIPDSGTTRRVFSHIIPADDLLKDEVIGPRLRALDGITDKPGIGITRGAASLNSHRPREMQLLDELVLNEGWKKFVRKVQEGHLVVLRKNFGGTTHYAFGAAPSIKPQPRIALIESVRMSSYLGDYGAGKTISSFSLLPGEKHEISIKTYKSSKQTATEASSILDGYEENTADEFAEDLSTENSSRDSEESNFSYHAEAEASATWGWGSASVSGGVAGGSASAREEFAKNVSNVTQKHSASVATKRQMEINTATESETEESEERAIKRTIENINVGRTLNFAFRQMNQKFVTALYITDVRIGFHNGDPRSWQEIPLPALEKFLQEMVKPAARDQIRHAIHDALYYTFDWRGHHRPMVEERTLKPGIGPSTDEPVKPPIITNPLSPSPYKYWRFCRHQTKLNRNEDGAEVKIPGVVIGVTQSTLPTDGIIVDALLGQGNALDAYSLGLQMESVRKRLAENDLAQCEIDLCNAKLEAVENKDTERADLLSQLFPENKPEENNPGDG